ncbi:MAG: glutathione S-transferase [Pedosphaera sp.]|nr:glutathione S-transferase [Pedosphaera sp.]
MLELIQFPWSPFCIVQSRILEFAGAPFKIINVSSTDSSQVWRLTRKRYYAVPVLKDGPRVLFETGNDTQVIAKYLDYKLRLGLFPADLEGVQSIIWRCIENEIEEMCFKLNDAYWQENVPPAEQLAYLRHKERKFGHGCLDQWRRDQKTMVAELTRRLLPFEEMLLDRPFLLGARPHFVDFDLYGMLGNFLYSGHYRLPASHNRLKKWHRRIAQLHLEHPTREKLPA